jgi:hypothetical protein
MIATREEKERFVLDLYSQGKSTREIAQIAHMSFRDIGFIIDKKEKEKEAREGQSRQAMLSTQAYSFFLQGRTPVQVAIALNIREPEATQYSKEYWKLTQLHSLGRIYEEIKDDIGYFVRLYRLAKVARMGVEQVVKVLEIANNDLPLVEHKCERLKREVDDLEAEKRNSARIFQELTDKISTMLKRLDSIHLDCEKELAQRDQLYQKRMKIEATVRYFENNNEEYVKIRKTIEEKVRNILSDAKPLLRIALLSLTESIRKDPDKYSSLVFKSSSSSTATPATDYRSQYYDAASYMYRQLQYPSQDYISMLIEEAEKLYNKLAKELGDESISDYAFSTSSSSLPVLSQSDEKNESHPRQTTESIQSYMHTEEHRFVQSEIDNKDQDK